MGHVGELEIKLSASDIPLFARTGLMDPSDLNSSRRLLYKDLVLVTIDVTFGLPDYPNLVQSFLWQSEDAYPRYAVMTSFLQHWMDELEGPIREATLVSIPYLSERELVHVKGTYTLQ